MRVLVYGVGVIGSLLAHQAARAGHQVTVLARGAWKQTITEKGLVIRHYAQRRTTVDHPRVVDRLEPDDPYDMVFVVLQAQQRAEVVDALAASPSPVTMVGNDMDAIGTYRALRRHHPDKQVLFGFQPTAGTREPGRLVCLHAQTSMVIGPVAGVPEPDATWALTQAFRRSGLLLAWRDQMDAWLKAHVAVILPVAFVCFATGYDLAAASPRQRHDVLTAVGEGIDLLDRRGVPVGPEPYRRWLAQGWRRRLLSGGLWLGAATPIGRLAAADHCRHAPAEGVALDRDFERLRGGFPMPAWDRLRAQALAGDLGRLTL